MCSCNNVEIGSYKNQTTLKNWWNNKFVCIDSCLLDEIKTLWKNKIQKTGCCCGHNKEKPMINVLEKHHYKMIKLKYNYYLNEFGVFCYTPISVY